MSTLDENMVKKLAIRSLCQGIGNMDYMNSLLIMENDLYEDNKTERMGEFGEAMSECDNVERSGNIDTPNQYQSQSTTAITELSEWCKCGKCKPMPQEVENKCLINSVSTLMFWNMGSRFGQKGIEFPTRYRVTKIA